MKSTAKFKIDLTPFKKNSPRQSQNNLVGLHLLQSVDVQFSEKSKIIAEKRR